MFKVRRDVIITLDKLIETKLSQNLDTKVIDRLSLATMVVGFGNPMSLPKDYIKLLDHMAEEGQLKFYVYQFMTPLNKKIREQLDVSGYIPYFALISLIKQYATTLGKQIEIEMRVVPEEDVLNIQLSEEDKLVREKYMERVKNLAEQFNLKLDYLLPSVRVETKHLDTNGSNEKALEKNKKLVRKVLMKIGEKYLAKLGYKDHNELVNELSIRYAAFISNPSFRRIKELENEGYAKVSFTGSMDEKGYLVIRPVTVVGLGPQHGFLVVNEQGIEIRPILRRNKHIQKTIDDITFYVNRGLENINSLDIYNALVLQQINLLECIRRNYFPYNQSVGSVVKKCLKAYPLKGFLI